MATLITADNHFGHKNIIKFCNRPFNNVNEMDEAMIANWNRVVTNNDEIYVVGDFAYSCSLEYSMSVVKRLNGTKHLIVGNHDKLALQMNAIRPRTWETIHELSEIIIDNQRIVLCHYALRTWHHSSKGVIQLFGHTHGKVPPYGKSFDCGVDCWNFTPINGKQILDKANQLPLISDITHNRGEI